MGHSPQRAANSAPLRRMSSRCCQGGEVVLDDGNGLGSEDLLVQMLTLGTQARTQALVARNQAIERLLQGLAVGLALQAHSHG